MNTKLLSAALIAVFLAGAPALAPVANAAQCKDAKGKFIKCPPAPKPAPAVKPAPKTQCRDAKGKFITCPPPKPVKPAQCRDAKGKFIKCK
jgi:hypothetical protein